MSEARETKPKGPGDLVHEVLGETFGITRRQTKALGKKAVRGAKIAGLMLASLVVIPVAMISLGLLLGPRGYEGLVAAPLAVLTAWTLIVYFGLRRRVNVEAIVRSKTAALPLQIARLLEDSRSQLPARAFATADGLIEQLEELAPTLEFLPEDSREAVRLRKLLVDDLTGLVEHYRRLPRSVRAKPLFGGPTPEEQLMAGLGTVSSELRRLQDRIATGDLHSLAAKQRYLELKYGGTGRDEPDREP